MSSIGGVGGGGGASGIGGGDAIGRANANAAEFEGKLGSGQATGSNDMQFYMNLQQAMLKEQQVYQALSTIMKARFDCSTMAIRNFK